MNIKRPIKYIIFFILISLSLNLSSQTISDSKLKAAYIFNFAKYIKWNNSDKYDKFRIGLITENKNLINELKVISQVKKLKDKKISVTVFNNISDIKSIDLLYISNAYSMDIKRIRKIIKTDVLLISDDCSNKREVMIDFSPVVKKKIQFKVNKPNIINSNMEISPNLLLLGGTEIDVAKLYQESQDSLKLQKNLLVKQQKEIDLQRAELDQQLKVAIKQKEEINKQKGELDSQTTQIAYHQKKIVNQKNEHNKLVNKRIELQKTFSLKIKQQESNLAEQNNEMKSRRAVLEEQTKSINDQNKKIDQQKNILNKQSSQLETQKDIIYVFIGFSIMILILIFFIYRSFRIKKIANKRLAEKNERINQQAEELLVQTETLQSTYDILSIEKKTVEVQNKNIKGSIRYALTIQQAVLPAIVDLKKEIDSFVIYRPKDIVSGDYYWMSKVATENTEKGINEKLFVIVADCTGHGVPGGFMSLIGTRLLSETVNEKKIYTPTKILDRIDYGVKKALNQDKSENDDGMDMCLCLIEKQDNNTTKITYAGAKRPLIYYKSVDNEIKIIKGSIKSVGGKNYDDIEYNQHELYLDKNDILYLTSDGFIDQNNPKGRKYGSTKLYKFLQTIGKESIEKQKTLLENELDKHQQTVNQRDDIAFMGIKL